MPRKPTQAELLADIQAELQGMEIRLVTLTVAMTEMAKTLDIIMAASINAELAASS